MAPPRPPENDRPTAITTSLIALPAVVGLGLLLLADHDGPVLALGGAIISVVAVAAVYLTANRGADPGRWSSAVATVSILVMGALVAIRAWPGAEVGGSRNAAATAARSAALPAAPTAATAVPRRGDPAPEPAREPEGDAELDDLFVKADEALAHKDATAAIPHFRAAFARAKQRGDPRALPAALGLAESLFKSGDTAEALSVVEEAKLLKRRPGHGPPPPEEVKILVLESALAAATDGHAAAIPPLRGALLLANRQHSNDQPLKDLVVGNLIDRYAASGDLPEALKTVDEHLEGLRGNGHLDSETMAVWLDRAGMLFGAAERFAESAERFGESVSIRESSNANDPLKTAFTRTNLALSLWRTGKKDEAREQLHEAKAVLDERLPPDHTARKRADDLAEEFGL